MLGMIENMARQRWGSEPVPSCGCEIDMISATVYSGADFDGDVIECNGCGESWFVQLLNCERPVFKRLDITRTEAKITDKENV